MEFFKPKIKPTAKITQKDEQTYSIYLSDQDGECELDHAGYLILEELETGELTTQEVLDKINEKYGLIVKKSQLEDFLQKLDHLKLLEVPLSEVGMASRNFPSNKLQFKPHTDSTYRQELNELIKTTLQKKTLFQRFEKATWIKLIFGAIVFFFPWPERSSGPAEIIPHDDREIRSSVSGKIEEVFVKEGDFVQAGKILVQLEGYQDQINRKQTEISKIDAELDILRRGATKEELDEVKKQFELSKQIERQSYEKYKQYSELLKNGLVSKQDFEDVNSKWKINIKELENVKAKLNLIEMGTRPEKIQAKEAEKNALLIDLKLFNEMNEKSQILSPIDGIVASPDIDKLMGKVVLPGDLIMRITNHQKITVLTEVTEKDLGNLTIGLNFSFKIQALPAETFHGKVTRISPIVEQSKYLKIGNTSTLKDRVVRIYCDMQNPSKQILPGMTGSASITTGWNSIGLLLFYDTFLALRLFFVF